MISDAIETRSKGLLHFHYGLILEGSESRQDPLVRIEMADTTLKEILDKLCEQAGWSYGFTPAGYMFANDRGFVGYRPATSGRVVR
jgi:hypothetical protein